MQYYTSFQCPFSTSWAPKQKVLTFTPPKSSSNGAGSILVVPRHLRLIWLQWELPSHICGSLLYWFSHMLQIPSHLIIACWSYDDNPNLSKRKYLASELQNVLNNCIICILNYFLLLKILYYREYQVWIVISFKNHHRQDSLSLRSRRKRYNRRNVKCGDKQ